MFTAVWIFANFNLFSFFFTFLYFAIRTFIHLLVLIGLPEIAFLIIIIARSVNLL